MNSRRGASVLLLMLGIILGAFGHSLWRIEAPRAVAQAPAAGPSVASLAAELEQVKAKLTDQSHVMTDVAYHFTNLWFAAQHGHWDLAKFYATETGSHLHWAVRVIPKRKDSLGREIDLESILQAFENAPLKQVQEAIAAKDKAAFEKAYRFSLESCYACHKAADKPFLRPQIPTAPAVSIINFDPAAEWPR
jgi:hypothetical protein